MCDGYFSHECYRITSSLKSTSEEVIREGTSLGWIEIKSSGVISKWYCPACKDHEYK